MLVVGTNDPDHPIAFERTMRDWLDDRGARVELYALGEYGTSKSQLRRFGLTLVVDPSAPAVE